MASIFTKLTDKIIYSLQEMFNLSFDADFNQNTTEIVGYDPTNNVLRRVTVGLNGALRSPQETIIIDYVSGTNPIYIGYSSPGTTTSQALWMIKKLTYDANNNPINVQYGGGVNTYTNIFDNRASLSYS